MSFVVPDGFVLNWTSPEVYRRKPECPHQGTTHGNCGLVWCPIPGLKGGRIELRPDPPHGDDKVWRYSIVRPGKPTIEGCGLTGLVSIQHGMLFRIPDLLKTSPWVVAKIAYDVNGWRVALQFAGKQKEIAGGPEGEPDRTLLAATKAVLDSLKRPVKLSVHEYTGRLRALFDEGYWPGQGLGSALEEIEKLSEPHYSLIRSKAATPAAGVKR